MSTSTTRRIHRSSRSASAEPRSTLMSKSLTCSDVLTAAEIGTNDEIRGPELTKLFWTLRQREKDLARRERYWTSINDALASAYDELERKTEELRAVKQELLLV